MSRPSIAFLKASEALWKLRHTHRDERVRYWTQEKSRRYRRWRDLVKTRPRGDAHRATAYRDYTDAVAQLKRWAGLRETAARNLRSRRRQLAERAGPRLITARQLGLTFQDVFGSTGPITRVFGHYTAGPRAKDATDLTRIARQVHAQHRAQGWGGCSYTVMVADDGTIALLNPPTRKAAGVAGHNTGSVHVNCPGTTGDKPTRAQEASMRWYVANAHTRRVPRAHRSPVDLRRAHGLVHSDRNATECPGDFTPMYRRVL